MVKKVNRGAEPGATEPSGLFDSQLAGSVKESAQQIWLAGMGAFAKAQEGGSKVFEGLIKEGMSLQRKTQAAAEEKLGDVAGKMSAMAEDVTAKAGQRWDKLESIFETRTAKALGSLGVPTAKDVAALSQRVDELAAAVARLAKAPAAAKGVAKPSAKAAVKRATASKRAGSKP